MKPFIVIWALLWATAIVLWMYAVWFSPIEEPEPFPTCADEGRHVTVAKSGDYTCLPVEQTQ